MRGVAHSKGSLTVSAFEVVGDKYWCCQGSKSRWIRTGTGENGLRRVLRCCCNCGKSPAKVAIPSQACAS